MLGGGDRRAPAQPRPPARDGIESLHGNVTSANTRRPHSSTDQHTANDMAAGFWMRFFFDCGIPPKDARAYAMRFIDHKITPAMLPYLDKEYLRDMGIVLVGDIIAILRHAKVVSNKTLIETAVRDTNIRKTTTVDDAERLSALAVPPSPLLESEMRRRRCEPAATSRRDTSGVHLMGAIDSAGATLAPPEANLPPPPLTATEVPAWCARATRAGDTLTTYIIPEADENSKRCSDSASQLFPDPAAPPVADDADTKVSESKPRRTQWGERGILETIY